MKKVIFTLASFLILCSIKVNAQSTGFIITGTVKDKYGNVESAEISLTKGMRKILYSNVYSSIDGTFSIRVPDAIKQIIVEKKEYQQAIIKVDNPYYKDTITLDIFLDFYSPPTTTTPSIEGETILDAPNTTVIITAEDIRNRGYVSLDEIMYDLPGFDVVGAGGTLEVHAYQRGYRTPFTQRTLFMVDGQIDNVLHSHTAPLSEQYPLTNIKQIEIIYGPASSVYGPNAFLGAINIITHDGKSLNRDTTQAIASIKGGSFNHLGGELTVLGKKEDLSYSISGTFYSTDGADLSDRWDFASNRWYSDTLAWGPILNQENNNEPFGKYHDPANGLGVLSKIAYKNTRLEFLHWDKRNAYGAYYAADRVQNNAKWYFKSTRISLSHKQELSKQFSTETLLQYRNSESSGKWVEALLLVDLNIPTSDTLPDGQIIENPDENFNDYSFVSNTDWRTDNSSQLFRQRFIYKPNNDFSLSGGIKYERKRLTKNYDIPGYYTAFGSSISSADRGPYGHGLGVYFSTDENYEFAPGPLKEMPPRNLAFTNDVGGFVQGIYDQEDFRLNLGLRYDRNSIYKNSWNPRGALIWKMSKNNRLKILYGEAFQEPAPLQLWGGFNGREGNINLAPEKARNLELVGMFYSDLLQLELSAFRAWYNNVIREDSQNAGRRNVHGFEARLRYSFESPILDAKPINTYFNLSYTKSKDEEYFDHIDTAWIATPGNIVHEVGDIAPIKIQAGLNFPIDDFFGINLRSSYQSSRQLYQRNALRADDFELKSIFLLHGNFYYQYKSFNISFKINNIFNNQYFHPGGEEADAGADFKNRSKGFKNSLIPQPGRNFLIKFTIGRF